MKLQRSVMITALLFILNHSSWGQAFIISPGSGVISSGGKIVLGGDVVNNGTIINSNNTFVFAGTTQSLAGTAPVLFNNLNVESGSTTTIATAGQTLSGILLSNGILNAGGKMTLLSTPTKTALIDGSGSGQVLGNITMQRYLPSGFGYKYFSSAFQGATVNEFGDDMNLSASFPAFYKYDESRSSSGWVSYTNSAGVMNPMNGYAVNFGSNSAALTADVTGVVNNGNLSGTLYNNNNTYTKGFNLVGNPYPSPIDWNAPSGWTRTNIDNSLYFFKASATDQYGGTYSTYISGFSSDGISDNIIPSMQGFFVHVSDGTWPVTGTLAFSNIVRMNDSAHSFAKSELSTSTPPFIRVVAGYSDDPLSFDPFCVYFDIKATYNFDGQYDAYKLFNTDITVTNNYSFGNDGSKLSINALPLNGDSFCNVRLGLKTERSGDVIFRIKDITGLFNYNYISITDVFTGVTQDLLSDKQYTVHLASGDYQNRFFLNLSNLITDIPDIIPEIDWFNIYSSKGILKAEIKLPSCENGVLKIYSLTGQTLYIYEINQAGYHEFSPVIKDGIYVVTFTTGNLRASKKIFIYSQ